MSVLRRAATQLPCLPTLEGWRARREHGGKDREYGFFMFFGLSESRICIQPSLPTTIAESYRRPFQVRSGYPRKGLDLDLPRIMTFVSMFWVAKEGTPKGGSGNRARGRATLLRALALPLVTDGEGSYPQWGLR
jgi:hypothetical protein